MPKIYLVRHGEAAAGFAGHADPGLSALGNAQAVEAAQRLRSRAEARLLSSPLRRAQETAKPLGELLGKPVALEPRVAEIPSPTDDLQARAQWLQGVMAGHWTDLPASLQEFRQGIIDCLCEQPTDSIVFSHFVAINLAVGAATDDPRMVIFRPGNASITELDVHQGQLKLVELGDQAQTKVN